MRDRFRAQLAMHNVGEALAAWASFYVMMGSSAAALTGLMFVVITLVRDQRSATEIGVATFTTPTVVHFCCALFTSALMSAPFRSFEPLAIMLSLVGGAGVLYVGRVAIQQARMESYRADAEDWTWHVGLPIVAYVTLLGGAIATMVAPSPVKLGGRGSVVLGH